MPTEWASASSLAVEGAQRPEPQEQITQTSRSGGAAQRSDSPIRVFESTPEICHIIFPLPRR
ncbi:hypothetical protein CVU37_02655 [candidate division BRC1 bacterium HGW-BRC1-1]|nr:MAG: hypothetical protein CVU37_02655 [candidate division BRC1 bacterium HGW-BRC1-1]